MTTYSSSSSGAAAAGPVTAIGGIALLINVVGLFTFTGLAVAIFAYIAVTILLMVLARLHEAKTTAEGAGNVALVLSWMAALATGVLVGALEEWVRFPHAAYVTLGFYGLAVAIWLCGRALSFVYACLFTAFGAALLAAVICMPAPPGSENPNHEENRTRVVARFVDEAGLGVEDVEVWFDLKWSWCDDPQLRKDADVTSYRPDNPYGLSPGSTPWQFTDDPRFRSLVIRARRRPNYRDTDAGYDDVRREMPIPRRGEEYRLQIELKERPHPNVAFLDVTVDRSGGGAYHELVLGPATELPRTSWGVDYEALNRGWTRGSASSVDGFRSVLRIDRELAGQRLFLHVNKSADGWKPVQPIEPLRLGERRRMTLPVR